MEARNGKPGMAGVVRLGTAVGPLGEMSGGSNWAREEGGSVVEVYINECSQLEGV
jgi:hypothetical protein